MPASLQYTVAIVANETISNAIVADATIAYATIVDRNSCIDNYPDTIT